MSYDALTPDEIQQLRLSEAHFRALFDAIDVGYCVLEMLFDRENNPVDYRFLETNPAFERHTGLVNARGRTIRELVPDLDESWFRIYGDVALTGNATRFENYAPAMGRWFDVYALRVSAPEERKVGLLFTDITARKTAQKTLQQSEEQLRDAQARLEAALSAGDIATWTFDLVQNRVVADANLARLFSVPPPAAAGVGLEAYLSAIHPEDRPHVEEAIREAISRQDNYEAEYRVALPDGTDRWLVARGKVERDAAGRAVALPGVVVDITARKQVEQERERLEQEQENRLKRERLLNQISVKMRELLEPDAILRTAVSSLGQALEADRCYFVRYDQVRDTAQIFAEWRRPDAALEVLENRPFRMSNYSVDRDPAYKAGHTHVVEDVIAFAPHDASPLLSLSIRALIRVPIAVGDQMTALGVAMAHEPRAWTADDVALTESVATLVRSALETASVQLRERNIARQLQDALQPLAPDSLPGLDLSSFYRPALEEAGVGGDFFDVFPVEKGCTALVVGDLSGKGLSAASQVATVRNMMRYALYSSATVAEAVTRLDHVLSEHDLLTGFATLFVGVYDHNRQTLTYANCGQEPGLVWRAASGTVEMLPPTGPVMGGFESTAGYEEQSLALAPGDALALFTDGLTDVGPSRRALLGVEGVSDLLKKCAQKSDTCSEDSAQTLRDCLMASVDAFAPGGMRDDIALLIGIVKRPD